MTAHVAPNKSLSKLKKLIGPRFGYRWNPNAPTAAEREEAKRELPEARAEKDAAQRAMDEHRNALLAGDERYQELRAAWQAAVKRSQTLAGRTMSHRITVGRSDQLWFSVLAEGDTWDEVVQKLEAKKN